MKYNRRIIYNESNTYKSKLPFCGELSVLSDSEPLSLDSESEDDSDVLNTPMVYKYNIIKY